MACKPRLAAPQESPRAREETDGWEYNPRPHCFQQGGGCLFKTRRPTPARNGPKIKGPGGTNPAGPRIMWIHAHKRGGVTSATLPSSRCPAPAHSAPPVRPPTGPSASPRPNPATRRSASQSAGEGWRDRLPGGLPDGLPEALSEDLSAPLQ